MSTYLRPGVFANEVLAPLQAGNGASADAAAAFIGPSNRGPLTPTRVLSWSEYAAAFGDFSNSDALASAVYQFFTNGGGEAFICRVASSTAAKATRSLNDRAGTPGPTLKVDAASPGTWGNDINVSITDGATGRFNLVVNYKGVGAGNSVETFADLSMVPTDSRYAVAVINSTSKYITTTDLASGAVAPANNPAVTANLTLTGGTDGGALVPADYAKAYEPLDSIPRPLVANLPGNSDVTIVSNLITFAQSTRKIFVVVDPAPDRSVAQVQAYAASLPVSAYAAVYYPWVIANDPSRAAPSITKPTPPGAAVVGQFLGTDVRRGPHKTPAGVDARLAGVVDVERVLSPGDYDLLNSSTPAVNAIKPVPGFGICIFGGRTLRGTYADRYVGVRRSLIFITESLKNLTQFAVFEPNDERLWEVLRVSVEGFLGDYFTKGGLRGSSPQQAFYVKCDATVNDINTIQSGVVNIEVGVALQYPAEFVVIRIGQFEGGSTATVNF